MIKNNFPHYQQADAKDCGPTCIKIIAKHYGKTFSIQKLRELAETTREGSNLLSISEAAEQLGFRSLGVKISLENLKEAPLLFADRKLLFSEHQIHQVLRDNYLVFAG
jgi:ATP-binding cassette subfamily B protein